MQKNIFTSKITAIVTMIGVAVGLGNVWRFPYMMGQFGGGTFLFIYLIFVLLFAIPALTGEWALGRFTRKDPLGAFFEAFKSPVGKIIAVILVISLLIADSYYVVIIGNVIYTTFHSAVFGFENEAFALKDALSNNSLQFCIAEGLIIAGMFVLYKGLKKGIELISLIFVPFFALVMIYLLWHTLRLPGAIDKVLEFLSFDFSQLTAKNIFAAMGQAFFSLSLGGCILVIYGSYLKPKDKLIKMAFAISLGDLGAALLTSLIIVPTVLLFGLNLDEGYTLLFSTIPVMFTKIDGGQLLSILFLLSFSFIAFLSHIAALQLVTGTLANNTKLSFNKSIIYVGITLMSLTTFTGFFPQIIPILDLVVGSGMQVFGSAIALIALTRGFGKKVVLQQIFSGKNTKISSIYFIWLKWIIPLALGLTLILYIYNNL
jgi:NSS family neurotransmitter:Na+ symporter